MSTLTITQPDDFHVHLRDGELLHSVIRFTARWFKRGLVMPNTTGIEPDLHRGIISAEGIVNYRHLIQEAAEHQGLGKFEPLMTLKLVPETTPLTIKDACEAGAQAAKLYPDGVTTNSAGGISDFKALYGVFEEMQTRNMVLCLHGEVPGLPVIDREKAFLAVLQSIVNNFPALRVVLEHVSTADAVQMIMNLPDTVAATITVHHLCLTLDDVIGDKGLQPHHYCKPIAKRDVDRQVLLNTATSGNPKFFLGTDSAPHPRRKKESANGAAGVFTAPIAMPLLAQIFEQRDALDQLGNFTSLYGTIFYGLPENQESLTLVKEPFEVPAEYDAEDEGVVPFMAGQTLRWSYG